MEREEELPGAEELTGTPERIAAWRSMPKPKPC